MNYSRLFRPSCPAAAVLACHVASAGAAVYQWTDSQGLTHYGDQLPMIENTAAIVLKQASPRKSAPVGLRPGEQSWLREINSRFSRDHGQSQDMRKRATTRRARQRDRCADERRRMKTAEGRDNFKQHARYLRKHCW